MSLTSYRTAPSRANWAFLPWAPRLGVVGAEGIVSSCSRDTGTCLARFGGDLLSHVLRRSTIGATALNGRVRNGAGCFARAMTTKPRKTRRAPARRVFLGVVSGRKRCCEARARGHTIDMPGADTFRLSTSLSKPRITRGMLFDQGRLPAFFWIEPSLSGH